jgi:hypothetical protein
MKLTTYHQNKNIGLTVWNTEEQCYYLIPFAEVTSFFRKISESIEIPADLVDAAYNFMSTYTPSDEVVLLTLNIDLLTVSVVSKDLKPSREALAQQLDWSLDKLTTFVYLIQNKCAIDDICTAIGLTEGEFDNAMSLVL